MLYLITRTSYDVLYFDTYQELADTPPIAGAFLKEGFGPCPICSEIGTHRWVLDIPDLHDFVEEHGAIVLSKGERDLFEVEVYDTYRE